MSHRNQNRFLRETGGQNSLYDFSRYIEEDVKRFGIVQKIPNPLQNLDVMISTEMDMYGGEADAYLVPQPIMNYCTMIPRDAWERRIVGDRGPNAINALAGSNLSELGRIPLNAENSEAMYESRQFPAFAVKHRMLQGVAEEDMQNLMRVRQVGEYIVSADDPNDADDYTTKNRSKRMMNFEENCMTEVHLQDFIMGIGQRLS
jgi:hypothetical protein